jgi:Divergent InlB B-repeat domain
MYPYADGANLFALLLDPGRDDYYGHTSSWLDVQDSEYLVRLDAQSQLSLGLQGAGRVVSDIPGVDCTTSCTSTWNAGTRLSLSATPTGTERFVRWGGACAGAVSLCNVTLDQATAVSAVFAPPSYPLRVTVGGRGVVRGASGRVFCPSECRVELASHTPVRITATPAKGWRLKSWSGACRGVARTCTLQMRKAATARAVFVRAAA